MFYVVFVFRFLQNLAHNPQLPLITAGAPPDYRIALLVNAYSTNQVCITYCHIITLKELSPLTEGPCLLTGRHIKSRIRMYMIILC